MAPSRSVSALSRSYKKESARFFLQGHVPISLYRFFDLFPNAVGRQTSVREGVCRDLFCVRNEMRQFFSLWKITNSTCMHTYTLGRNGTVYRNKIVSNVKIPTTYLHY